jgi:diketogulonate reductase-like aldo/keto reductase
MWCSTVRSMDATFDLGGHRVPRLVYGTAWKEERTAGLVTSALRAGFRGVDTANQRKHYFEAGAGEGIAAAGVAREELFLQSKFTYARGQDRRLPYDPKASITVQVEQSFRSSLEHLGTTWLDSLVLHGPENGSGWSAADREAWRAMEALQRSGKVRLLGVSNVELDQLRTLCAVAEVAPLICQNRTYASAGWDREVRAFCRERGIAYQGFSLLTANRAELASPRLAAIAERLGATPAQVVFRFAMEVGMMPLTGTSDPAHMAEDLRAHRLDLTAEDVAVIERLGG